MVPYLPISRQCAALLPVGGACSIPDEPRWPYYLGLLAVPKIPVDLASAERAFELSLEHAPTSSAALLRLADLKLTMRQPETAETLLPAGAVAESRRAGRE